MAHRDIFREFFTADEALGDYMTSLLETSAGDKILEPAAGEGHLIDAILKQQPSVHITAYELNETNFGALKKKYHKNSDIHIDLADTITCQNLDLIESFGPKFDRIVANPPYGGWQDFERRKELKKRFPGFYIRETYTLFLLRCLRLLAEGGRLVFIVPNTFLYLHLHAPVRKFVLTNFVLESVDFFKSSLFPGISFGYAGLCIISILGKEPTNTTKIRLRSVDSSDKLSCLYSLQENSVFKPQREILNEENHSVPLHQDENRIVFARKHGTIMADLAECVTGFYSGADKTFLRVNPKLANRAKKYELVENQKIEKSPSLIPNILDGINNVRHFVPILKGGGFQFVKPMLWYVDWSKEAVEHYKKDSKARFQNPTYYFRRGIGFPMVTSKKPTAMIIEESLFDQSIVGIFPKGTISLEFLLAYCNSETFWRCLKSINPSANNSAKYILRTPVILPPPSVRRNVEQKTKKLLRISDLESPEFVNLKNDIIHTIDEYAESVSSVNTIQPVARPCATEA